MVYKIILVIALFGLQACVGNPKKVQSLPGGLRVVGGGGWEFKSAGNSLNDSKQITLTPVKGKDPNLKALVLLTFERDSPFSFVDGTSRVGEEWVSVRNVQKQLFIYKNKIAKYYLLEFSRGGTVYFATLVISGSCDERFYKAEMLRIVGSLM